MTGVSRERLRTWERRHGFPRPVRANGSRPRRYAIADAARVVAVRHAVDDGVPVAEAVTGTERLAGGATQPDAAVLSALLDAVPAPVLLLSGPEPLRVRWLNAAAARVAQVPQPGATLAETAPWLADGAADAARELFASAAPAAEVRHAGAGRSAGASQVRSLLWRLAPAPGRPALVGVLTGAASAERELGDALAALRAEHMRVRDRGERHARWVEALAVLAVRFQEDRIAPADAVQTLVKRLDLADGVLTVFVAGDLVIGRSARGRLGPETVTVLAFDDLAAAMRTGRPAWLQDASAAALGVPERLHALLVPMRVAGEALGALVLALRLREPIDDDIERLLRITSTSLGFAMLRDRLIDRLRRAR